jgi:hypothetical protein
MTDPYGEVLAEIIERRVRNAPRTLQTDIGPSEIGVDCRRQLGFKVLNVTPRSAAPAIAWRAWVGTAMHSELEVLFTLEAMETNQRWLTETRVVIDDRGRYGSCDLYDAETCRITDWKSKSKTSMAHVKKHGPSERERKQQHLYGLGMERAGYVVEHVGLFYMMRDGEFTQRFYWSEPYDREVALAALANLDEVADLTDALGRAAIPLLETADDCKWCPWLDVRASPRSEVSCLGDKARDTRVTPADANAWVDSRPNA